MLPWAVVMAKMTLNLLDEQKERTVYKEALERAPSWCPQSRTPPGFLGKYAWREMIVFFLPLLSKLYQVSNTVSISCSAVSQICRL
jgi:hypothetical protein